MRKQYVVVVVGGGPAGYPAAVQAARLGASTLLVEKNGALGGTTTVAGVALPGLFHAWGKQIIAGIGWDAVRTSVELAGRELPDFTEWRRPHFRLQVPVVPAIYAAVLDAMVVDSGADLLLHTQLAAVRRTDDGWRIALCTKGGLVNVDTRMLVDCTGDADATGLAGFARHSNGSRQPGTLMVRFGGYDPNQLDYPALERAHGNAVTDGRLGPADLADNPVEKFLRQRGANAIHVTGIQGGTSESRTTAELTARRTLLRIFRFFAEQPGLEGLSIDNWAIECGIRETYTIDGVERITVDDYTSGRIWDDALSYSFYPIDVHRPSGHGIDIRTLAYGTVPTIPRGAMLPRGAELLVVAGRAVSGDQEANSAYRVQASCMAMGQAAGVLAALAARSGETPEALPMQEIRAVLRQEGAIVPGDVHIPTSHTPDDRGEP